MTVRLLTVGTIATAGRAAKIKVEVDDQLDVQRWNAAEPPG